MTRTLTQRPWFDAALAWYFVSVWGSGFLATKITALIAVRWMGETLAARQ